LLLQVFPPSLLFASQSSELLALKLVQVT